MRIRAQRFSSAMAFRMAFNAPVGKSSCAESSDSDSLAVVTEQVLGNRFSTNSVISSSVKSTASADFSRAMASA